eukprot:7515014-Pyramimonas_sp.AAC.2
MQSYTCAFTQKPSLLGPLVITCGHSLVVTCGHSLVVNCAPQQPSSGAGAPSTASTTSGVGFPGSDRWTAAAATPSPPRPATSGIRSPRPPT